MEIVAVDIGGTHARFAIAEVENGRVVKLGEPCTQKTAEHASLQTAWQAFEAHVGRPLPKAASQVRPSRAKACGMHACDPARAATPRRLGMGDHGLRVGRRARPPVWRVARCRPQDMCYPIHPCATHLMCAIGCVICEIACAISDV